MDDPKRIPKPLYQAIILLLLAVVIGLTIYWSVTRSGLYALFDDWLGGHSIWLPPVLVFLALFVLWMLLAFPLRRMSDMPTMREELGVSWKDGWPALWAAMKESYEREQAKNEEMYRAREYTPELKRRARMIGAAFVLAGVIVSLGAVATILITLETGHLLEIQVVLFILGPVLVLAGIIQLITGRSVIRR